MKDKEWLLSFDCPLRFIWSHSALKEGWDNPNVFQVCTLIEQKSTFTCRQKIGRGLRLCVNQDGERIEDKNINLLHVMANESFAEFADTLQKEIEQETGIKFGVLHISMFSGMAYTETKTVEKTITPSQAQGIINHFKNKDYIDEHGKLTETAKKAVETKTIELPTELEPVKEHLSKFISKADGDLSASSIENITYTETITEEKTITYDDAAEIMDYLENKDYITKTGKIKDTMKEAIINGNFELPARHEVVRKQLENIISYADKKPPIRDASRDVIVKLKKQVVLEDPDFKAIWEKIEQKTTYRVQIDSEELIRRTVKSLKEMPPLPKARIVSRSADIDIQDMGVTHRERDIKVIDIQSDYSALPHILSVVREQTHTTKSTTVRILKESGRIGEFINNPQLFIENFVEILKYNLHSLAIDGIKYVKLNGEKYYALEIFDSKELIANIDKNAVAVKNSVYDYIIYDSDTVEKPFAKALDDDPEVKMFFKLPQKFKINTPIGTYNPDWAVYMDRNGEEKLYFVLETKGSTSLLDLRAREELKIYCGKRHFEALGKDIELRVVKSWIGFKRDI